MRPIPKPEWTPIWLQCKACETKWDDWQPSDVPVATWVAHVKTYHCPNCGHGGKSILIRMSPLDEPPADAKPSKSNEELWRDLCEKDDRTSPAEYPDMALIGFDEFAALRAEATLAEKERCAKVAEHEAAIINSDDALNPARSEMMTACMIVAAAIRKGSE